MSVRHSDAMSAGRTPVIANIGHGTARILRSLSVSTMAVLAVLLFAVILLALAPLGYDGKAYPGVHVAGIGVGGLSEPDALKHVQSRTGALAEQPVTLIADGKTWTPRPADLGITYDPEQSVDAAMAYGRNATFESESLNATFRDDGSVMIPMSIRFDADRFDAYLDQIEAELGRGPVNATVTIDSTDVVVTPAQDGWTIDRTALQTMMRDQINLGQPVSVTVPLQKQSAASSTEHAAATKAMIEQALAEPLVLTLGDHQWTIAPEQLAAAVRVEPDRNGSLVATLDPEGVNGMVAGIAKDVDVESTDAWVQDLGTHQWLVPAKQG
ncbi:MAG: peptidoglycan binding domain-containing protein, partial [Chloroflexota bacterium]|nr:peptidoglycan binding domain-containing protein [Chloroflexota bacterium]